MLRGITTGGNPNLTRVGTVRRFVRKKTRQKTHLALEFRRYMRSFSWKGIVKREIISNIHNSNRLYKLVYNLRGLNVIKFYIALKKKYMYIKILKFYIIYYIQYVPSCARLFCLRHKTFNAKAIAPTFATYLARVIHQRIYIQKIFPNNPNLATA